MASEQTMIMIKPDAFTSNAVGEVISRIEKSKFKIVAAKMFKFDNTLAQTFYAEHKGKPFFRGLIDFMTSGPCLGMVVEAENAIQNMRTLVGATDPRNADPGTVRYDYAADGRHNIIHASDSPENFEREKKLLFTDQEIVR